MSIDKWKLRELADTTRRFGEAEPPLNPYLRGYLAGMEDALRYASGDTPPTEQMREILPYGLLEDES